jgi:hypothetical protein
VLKQAQPNLLTLSFLATTRHRAGIQGGDPHFRGSGDSGAPRMTSGVPLRTGSDGAGCSAAVMLFMGVI